MADINDRFERLCLEEYKALRAESLRCAGTVSNTVWLGVTQFAVTIGAAAVFAKDNVNLRLLVLALLYLLSLTASSMFLSELWKYARVGRYIREKIEKRLTVGVMEESVYNRPIFWENWIKGRRARTFYRVALIILQSPIILIAVFIGISIALVMVPRIAGWLPILTQIRDFADLRGAWLLVSIVLIVVDIVVVYTMIRQISEEGKLGLTDD